MIPVVILDGVDHLHTEKIINFLEKFASQKIKSLFVTWPTELSRISSLLTAAADESVP